MSSITPYQQTLALDLAMSRIESSEKSFEHPTASWATTKVSHHFNGLWVLTPEMILEGRRKPDIIVEKVHEGPRPRLGLHAAFEFKKAKGARFEDALNQLAETIPFAVDKLGYTVKGVFEMFAVVVIGTDIGFFEYHNDITNLDEEKIDHFRGCVSFTTSYSINGVMTRIFEHDQIPVGLKSLFFNEKRLGDPKDPETKELRKEAQEYTVPCVFSLNQHQNEIEFMFKHMVEKAARASVG
jgi:hypothetical protein